MSSSLPRISLAGRRSQENSRSEPEFQPRTQADARDVECRFSGAQGSGRFSGADLQHRTFFSLDEVEISLLGRGQEYAFLKTHGFLPALEPADLAVPPHRLQEKNGKWVGSEFILDY